MELRKLIDFQLHTLASADICKTLNIPEIICASQTTDTDKFFNSIHFRSVLSYLEKLLMTLLARDIILPERSTLFWNINDTPISRKLVELGSLEPDLDDLDGITTPIQYSVDKQTVSVECGLRPSGFIDRIPKGPKDRDHWTSHQRDKATGNNVHYIQSVQHLTLYASKLSYSLLSSLTPF